MMEQRHDNNNVLDIILTQRRVAGTPADPINVAFASPDRGKRDKGAESDDQQRNVLANRFALLGDVQL